MIHNKSSPRTGDLYKSLLAKETFYVRSSEGRLTEVDSVEYLLTMDDDAIRGDLGMPVRFKPRNKRHFYNA